MMVNDMSGGCFQYQFNDTTDQYHGLTHVGKPHLLPSIGDLVHEEVGLAGGGTARRNGDPVIDVDVGSHLTVVEDDVVACFCRFI